MKTVDPRGRRGRFTYRIETRRRREQEAETASKGVEPQAQRVAVGVHPQCRTAALHGFEPCSRCSWLLDLDNEGAAFFAAKIDEVG